MHNLPHPNLHMSRYGIAIALILCLLAAGCGSANSTSTPVATTAKSRPTTTAAQATASTGLTGQERQAINNGADTFDTAAKRGNSTDAALAATTEAAQVTAMADAHRGTPLESRLRELAVDWTAVSTAITHHNQAALNQAEAQLQQLTNSLGHT